MAAPGFYDDRAAAQPTVDRHQSLMWTVGDLMQRWEALQAATDVDSLDSVRRGRTPASHATSQRRD
jgi:hypothetical protein